MIHEANKLINKKLLIVTPSLMSQRPISYEALGSYFVPADAFKKFRKLDNPDAGNVIIIGSMSFGNHSQAQLKENYFHYYETKMLFHKMDIDIDIFNHSNDFYCNYLLEDIFARLKSKGLVDLKTGKLKLGNALDSLLDYIRSCDIKPDNLILDQVNIIDMVKSSNFNFLTSRQERGSYSTCFKRDLYFDPNFTEVILSIAKSKKLMDLVNDEINNLYTISYINSRTISKEMVFKSSVLIALQNPLLLPDAFVTSDRVIPSPYSPMSFVEDLEVPFISDILRVTLLSAFPFSEPHKSSVSATKIYSTYVTKFRIIVVNIAIRVTNLLIKFGDGKTHPVRKQGKMIYNIDTSENGTRKDGRKTTRIVRTSTELSYSKI